VIVVATKRTAGGRKFTGGSVSWGKLQQDIHRLLSDAGAVITTMVDFYALPNDMPGLGSVEPHWGARRRVAHVEAAVAEAIGRMNFVPHIMLHEVEALLYVDPRAAGEHFGDDSVRRRMKADLAECGEPELVDDGPATAPSKRIMSHCQRYLKTSDGPTILADIGLPAIRNACPHFDGWLSQIEALAP
jgi:Domain of unknown function (DUF4276)